ncbi:MAG: kynureninase [Saprospiraceae bacterium]|nr:kynureninase [Saprospiraceae bacterium]
MQPYLFDPEFAIEQDRQDPLRQYRDAFHFPKVNGKQALYFCGNSLGLQPKSIREAVLRELDQWSELAVEGHFEGALPWMHYHKFLQPQTAHIAGAQAEEVVVMNTLTTNLHLMMVSFYRPTRERFKIIMEAGAFPSDQYALETQARYHGLNPDDAIVEVTPRPGEETLRTEDILAAIETHGAQTALVLFGGVNYYTGQYYDLKAITDAGHKAGAYVGFDLAHAAGNLPLHLHDWGSDFAVWCSYKYLNSGPGGPGGVFVHERHGNNPDLPRFAGWWGHDESSRFLMRKGFHPMPGAAGWQLSNAQILSFAAHKASLDIFAEAGMLNLREKSLKLTGYLEFILHRCIEQGQNLRIITPADPAQRGCQLSVRTGANGRHLFDYLAAHAVLCDWREDNLSGEPGGVIRISPVPLYNGFEEVYEVGRLLEGFRDL